MVAVEVTPQEAGRANGGGVEAKALGAFGQRWGAAEMFDLARQANENSPKLRAFDPQGVRQDFVAFHPAYHLFMAESTAARLQASTWRADAGAAPAPAPLTPPAPFSLPPHYETTPP